MAEATLYAKHSMKYLHGIVQLPCITTYNEGMLVCCTAGKKDYHQHVKVDSTDHNHKHASPEMDVRDFPCSSCVAEHRTLVGKPDCHRNNLYSHISCCVMSKGTTSQRLSKPSLLEGRRIYRGKNSHSGIKGYSTLVKEQISVVCPAEPQVW